MSAQNNYVAEYVPDNWSWYERDGLLTYIDKFKCDRFLEKSRTHFQETPIINFDIIHRQAGGEKNCDKDLKNIRRFNMTRFINT